MATFGFNRTALRATQPKIISMLCARWTIICGVPSKISVIRDIREAIGEIQLHTIDNVLKNWTDLVGYCMASRGSHSNQIIFHY